MKNHIHSIIIVTMLLLTGAASAQSTEMTLKQAQEYALKNSQTSKNTQYDVESALLATKELIASGLPQIDGSMQYTSYLHVPVMVIPAGGFIPGSEEMRVKMQQPENVTLGVTAKQLIFNGTWLVGVEAARSYEILQNKNIEKSNITVKDTVAKAYYQALVALESLNVLKDSRAALSKTLSDTEAMYQNGFTEKQDVDQLMLSVNDLDIQIAYAEFGVKLMNDFMKMIIGYPISNELILKDNIETVLASDENGDLLNTTFDAKSNIDYQLTNQMLALQRLNVKRMKSAYLPTLAAFMTFQTQAMRQDFNFFDTSKPYFYGNFWGVQLNVPILSGGQRRHAVSKADVEVRRYSDNLSFAEQGLELAYRRAKFDYDNANKVYEASRRSMQLANDIYNTADIKYKEGIGSSFDLTQRNTQAIGAKGAYIQALHKLLQAKINLTKALNQL